LFVRNGCSVGGCNRNECSETVGDGGGIVGLFGIWLDLSKGDGDRCKE
jgi:hypothetical protein